MCVVSLYELIQIRPGCHGVTVQMVWFYRRGFTQGLRAVSFYSSPVHKNSCYLKELTSIIVNHTCAVNNI